MDRLSLGDSVTLYYDDNSYTESELVNRLTRFIDKNEEAVYIQSSKTDKTFGYSLLIIGIIIMAILILTLKKLGKIE